MKQINKINSTAQYYIDRIAKACEFIKPLVVMSTITYNHEKYIADTLDGFLAQQTTFPTVAIVHDDASTDGTAEILRQYAEKYPDKIFPIFESENQYSKPNDPLTHIMDVAVEATGASYVAYCEGDDYWTDSLKLQKQVGFLEANHDFTMIFANSVMHWENGLKPDCTVVNFPGGLVTPQQLYASWQAPTATIVVRRSLFQSDIYKKSTSIKNAAFTDIQLGVCSGLIGKIYFLDEIVSVYRKTGLGMSDQIVDNPLGHIQTRLQLSKIYGKEYVKIDKVYASKYFIVALKNLFKHYPDNIVLAFTLLRFTPIKSLCELKWIYRILKAKF